MEMGKYDDLSKEELIKALEESKKRLETSNIKVEKMTNPKTGEVINFE